jgi:hypothetical protein
MMRMLLGCLLYRLGGAQTFTAAEIDEICKEVKGIQWVSDENLNLTVIARSPEALAYLEETQKVLHI